MKKIFTFILAAVTSIGMWATQEYSYTGYSTQINNGWTHDYGDTYVGRKGSNYTPSNNGLPTGNSNIFAAFEITGNSSIEVIFVWTKTNGDLSDKKIDLAKLSKDDYDKLALASTGTGNDVKYSIGNFSSIKSASISINRSDANQDKSFEFDTIVGAGYYAVYTASSINASALIKKINVTAAAPAVTHTLTWDFAGGSCSATAGTNYTAGGDVAEGATITYPANNTMSKDGYDFNGWSTSVTTMPTSDLTITAQWVEHTLSSDATLSALSVAGCTLSPAFASDTTAYTVALPFYASMPAVSDVTATKNDSYAKDPEVTIADNVISIACEAEDGTKKTYTVTVNIAELPAASTSINIEQLVLDNSKSYSYTTALTAANISYANLNGLDSLAIGDADHSRPDYNESFLGLKIKKQGGYIQMVIPAGKTLKIKFGNVADNLKLTINGVAQSDISKSTSVYEHTATDNELIKIATSSGGTVVLKQIMIDEEIAVVRPFEVTVATSTNGTASVELEKYAKGEEVTVNCVPASGYKLASIAVSGYNDKGAETDVTVTGNKFTMPGSPVTITVTFSIATSIDNTSDAAKAQKRIENGQLVIEKNGQVFNAMGQTIR